MKPDIIVVTDSNILFTFFWKTSSNPDIILNKKLYLIAPEKALEEINKYTDTIRKKAGITEKEFKIIYDDLFLGITFFPREEYGGFIEIAKLFSPDMDDVEFFALALRYKCPIWSNEKKLKLQNKIDVLNSHELSELLG